MEGIVRDAFPRFTICPHIFRVEDQSDFLHECQRALRSIPQSSDLSRPRRVFCHYLVERATKDPLRERLDLLEEEFHSFWSCVPAADYLSKHEFSLTWQLARNRLPLNNMAFIWGLTDLPDCEWCGRGLEEMAFPLWNHHVSELTARITPKKLVLIDCAYVLPLYSGVKWMVFLEEVLQGNCLSHQNLIQFFEHQLKMKIRSDRKCLISTNFSKRQVTEASLISLNEASLDFSLLGQPRLHWGGFLWIPHLVRLSKLNVPS